MVQLYHKAASIDLNGRDKIYLLVVESFKKRLSHLTLDLHVNYYAIKMCRIRCTLIALLWNTRISEKLCFEPEKLNTRID